MKNIIIYVFSIFIAFDLFAWTTFQTTLSTGYYRDIEENHHTTVFHSWKLNQFYQSGFESFVEIELNNSFINDTWKVYPHQIYITVPFDNGFENAPFHNSKVKLGRQLFTESFALNTLNGAYFVKYFTPESGFTLFMGGLDTLEKNNITFDDHIYGTLIFSKQYGTNLKLGPFVKGNLKENRYLGVFSIMRNFEMPLNPLFFLKNEINLEHLKIEQFLTELDLSYGNYYLSNTFSSRKPDPLVLKDKNIIYRLFSISHQKGIGSSLTWNPEGNFHITGRIERTVYNSQDKEETGNLQELSFSLFYGNYKINPSITRIASWGGKLFDFNINFKYNIHDKMELKLAGDITKVDKINGISGMLYTAKSAIDYYFLPKWRALFALEAERNHLFDLNGRVALYVTHFYY